MPEDSVVAGPEHVPLTTVTIKLPTFWTDSQEVWLLQAKAQFENKRITTSQTKFTHCIASPLQDVTCRLLDLVRSPQADHKALWRRLIQIYTFNDFQRYQTLQSLPLLSDQSPSELIDKMLLLFPRMRSQVFSSRVYSLGVQLMSLVHLLSESINDPCGMA